MINNYLTCRSEYHSLLSRQRITLVPSALVQYLALITRDILPYRLDNIILRSHECLIGRCDHTAIIDYSSCHMEETNFREVVSHREAQQTIAQTSWCNRHQKKAVLLCLITRQVHFAQAVQAIEINKKSNQLGFEWMINNWQLERASDRTCTSQQRRQLKVIS